MCVATDARLSDITLGQLAQVTAPDAAEEQRKAQARRSNILKQAQVARMIATDTI